MNAGTFCSELIADCFISDMSMSSVRNDLRLSGANTPVESEQVEGRCRGSKRRANTHVGVQDRRSLRETHQ